ncbi:MAG: hypothetical protein ACRDQA_27560 [Nocardioidaceae bacterium]
MERHPHRGMSYTVTCTFGPVVEVPYYGPLGWAPKGQVWVTAPVEVDIDGNPTWRASGDHGPAAHYDTERLALDLQLDGATPTYSRSVKQTNPFNLVARPVFQTSLDDDELDLHIVGVYRSQQADCFDIEDAPERPTVVYDEHVALHP